MKNSFVIILACLFLNGCAQLKEAIGDVGAVPEVSDSRICSYGNIWWKSPVKFRATVNLSAIA